MELLFLTVRCACYELYDSKLQQLFLQRGLQSEYFFFLRDFSLRKLMQQQKKTSELTLVNTLEMMVRRKKRRSAVVEVNQMHCTRKETFVILD